MDKISILFVCTGNICRSPTADAIFTHMLQKAGLENAFIIDSAGTHGYHIGHPADDRAISVAAKRGVDMTLLRARQVGADDFDAFDYILAMDMGHFNILKDIGKKGSKARLLMFSHDDVPDPYYGDTAGFERVYDLIERGCAAWLAKILQGQAA